MIRGLVSHWNLITRKGSVLLVRHCLNSVKTRICEACRDLDCKSNWLYVQDEAMTLNCSIAKKWDN